MSEETSDPGVLVQRIHAASRRAVLVCTGGGASAAAWLLAVPGASQTILEVSVPYDSHALAEFLGAAPRSYSSAETAAQLARRARDRAAWLDPHADAVGVACTASLRSDRPKKGDHRVHVAWANSRGVQTRSLTFIKEARDRAGEEEVASRLVLTAVAEAFGVPGRLDLGLLEGESVTSSHEASGALADLLEGQRSALCVRPDGRIDGEAGRPTFLLPGSFNPLHHGHRNLFEVAARRLGGGAFELSISNADKPTLGEAEVRRRAAAFAWYRPVWLTRTPTFADKAPLFPGCIFVIGADTAVRILQPRFYGDSVEKMHAALAAIRSAGCRFLVAGRVDGAGRFVGREEAAIQGEFADLFDWLSEGEFRADISSTALRG